MRGRSAALISVTIAMLALAACSGGGLRTEVRGSEMLVTERPPVAGFSSILVSGHGVVHVAITGTESLEVEAEDNILAVLTIEVVNGQLRLGHLAHTNIIPTRDITYRITAARLDGVAVAGSGTLDVAGVTTGDFAVSVAGSGSVIPTGRAGNLIVDVSGSGAYLGAGLEAGAVAAGVSGSGEAVVGVTRTLAATVSGSGAIRYLGDPLVAAQVSGSGSVLPYQGGRASGG